MTELLMECDWTTNGPNHENLYIHIQDARNLAQDARNLAQDASNLAQDASNLAQDARNLAQDARNLLQDARNLAQDARTIQYLLPNLTRIMIFLLFNSQIFPIILNWRIFWILVVHISRSVVSLSCSVISRSAVSRSVIRRSVAEPPATYGMVKETTVVSDWPLHSMELAQDRRVKRLRSTRFSKRRQLRHWETTY